MIYVLLYNGSNKKNINYIFIKLFYYKKYFN